MSVSRPSPSISSVTGRRGKWLPHALPIQMALQLWAPCSRSPLPWESGGKRHSRCRGLNSKDTVPFSSLAESPWATTSESIHCFQYFRMRRACAKEFMVVSGGFFGLGVRIPQCPPCLMEMNGIGADACPTPGCHSRLESLVPDGVAGCAAWAALGGGPDC